MFGWFAKKEPDPVDRTNFNVRKKTIYITIIDSDETYHKTYIGRVFCGNMVTDAAHLVTRDLESGNGIYVNSKKDSGGRIWIPWSQIKRIEIGPADDYWVDEKNASI